jgi:hypothetical protein
MSESGASVVLAHGAWADGSSWSKVIAGLRSESVEVVAAPLPLTSLAEDVAALDRTLERVAGPVVVAGHAYAGAVIACGRRGSHDPGRDSAFHGGADEGPRADGSRRPHAHAHGAGRGRPDDAGGGASGRTGPVTALLACRGVPRDIPDADVRFVDTGHFALETHVEEIATAIRGFLERTLS